MDFPREALGLAIVGGVCNWMMNKKRTLGDLIVSTFLADYVEQTESVTIYLRELTATEIQTLYSGGQ